AVQRDLDLVGDVERRLLARTDRFVIVLLVGGLHLAGGGAEVAVHDLLQGDALPGDVQGGDAAGKRPRRLLPRPLLADAGRVARPYLAERGDADEAAQQQRRGGGQSAICCHINLPVV